MKCQPVAGGVRPTETAVTQIERAVGIVSSWVAQDVSVDHSGGDDAVLETFPASHFTIVSSAQ
jgi:hypothetical protein